MVQEFVLHLNMTYNDAEPADDPEFLDYWNKALKEVLEPGFGEVFFGELVGRALCLSIKLSTPFEFGDEEEAYWRYRLTDWVRNSPSDGGKKITRLWVSLGKLEEYADANDPLLGCVAP